MSIKHKEIAAIRTDYIKYALNERDVPKEPLVQFEKWFNQALKDEGMEPNAMVLATVDQDNQPSSRVVLLKDLREGGLCFFTNYESKKGQEIKGNSKVSLLFFWPELERQVRIHGVAEMLPGVDSDDYFNSRPKASRIGALASHQSRVLKSRKELEDSMDLLTKEYSQREEVPRPVYWGGYLVRPTYFEFWQGGQSRLHDRVIYKRDSKDEDWIIERLSP